MAILDNLIEHWSLGAASGNETGDHASIVLTDGNSVGSATGKIGNGRDFENTSNHFMNTADSDLLSTGNIDFTVSCWVKLEGVAVTQHLITKWNTTGNNREYILGFSSTTGRFLFLVSPDGTGTGTTQVDADTFGDASAGVWYHLTAWHDATNNLIGISVNDVEDTASHTTGLSNLTADFQLGRSSAATTNDADGVIDEVSFWKRLLTTDERTALFNEGDGVAYPFEGVDPPAVTATFVNGSTVALPVVIEAATCPYTATGVPVCVEVLDNTSLLPYLNSTNSNLALVDADGTVYPQVVGVSRIAEKAPDAAGDPGGITFSVANPKNSVVLGNLSLIGFQKIIALNDVDWCLGAWNSETGEWSSVKLGDQPAGQEDDHNNPTVCVSSTGYIYCFCVEHNTAVMRMFKSDDPFPETLTGLTFTETDLDSLGGGDEKSYADCEIFQSLNDLLTVIWRDGDSNPRHRILGISDDDGETWLEPVLVSSTNQRPYTNTCWDNTRQRLHVFYNLGAGSEITANLNDFMHGYADFSAWDGTVGSVTLHESDGTPIGVLGTDSFSATNGTIIHDASENGSALWGMGVPVVDEDGYPVCLYSECPSAYDIRARYARLTSEGWMTKELLAEGQTVQRYYIDEADSATQAYPHGMALMNADIAFIIGEDGTGRAPLYKFTTADQGETFTQSKVLTPASGAYRVTVPRGAGPEDDCQFFYMHGQYGSDTWVGSVPMQRTDLGIGPLAGVSCDICVVAEKDTDSGTDNNMYLQTGGASFTLTPPFATALHVLNGELRGYRASASNIAMDGAAAVTAISRFSMRAANALTKPIIVGNTSSSNYHIAHRIDANENFNTLWFGSSSDSSPSTFVINAEEWSSAMSRWDGVATPAAESAMIVNGAEAQTRNTSIGTTLQVAATPIPLFIGNNKGGGANGYFDGLIPTVIIWLEAKTDTFGRAATIMLRGDQHELGELEVLESTALPNQFSLRMTSHI